MTAATVDVNTTTDGTLVIHLHGVVDATDATALRLTLVRAIRQTRPAHLVVDLADVRGLDPINLGTMAAACHLGDDQQTTVVLRHPSAELADLLVAAGVPRHRLRHAG